MLAAAAGHDKIVKLIVDGGADVRMKDRNDDTALEYAEKNNRVKVKGLQPWAVRLRVMVPPPVVLADNIYLPGAMRVFAALASVLQPASPQPLLGAFWRPYSSYECPPRRQSSASNPSAAPPQQSRCGWRRTPDSFFVTSTRSSTPSSSHGRRDDAALRRLEHRTLNEGRRGNQALAR